MNSALAPLHLGPLHPVDAFVMTGLALAPVVVLAIVILIVSRRDRRAEKREQAPRDA